MKHNHITRDIKPRGQCPACDAYHDRRGTILDELPPRLGAVRSVSVDWEEAKALLMANEGKWVLAARNVANSTPQQLRSGRYRAFRVEDQPHFEFAVRKPENPDKPYGPRRVDLWGRYTKKVKR